MNKAAKPEDQSDSRDEYLSTHLVGARNEIEVPDKAIDDLRYFAAAAAKGKRMKFDALRDWMRRKHGLDFGPSRWYVICEKNKILPWWSRRG